MRVDVTEPVLCGCDTCVQHRTLCIPNTQETQPPNVLASSGPVQALGSTSDQTSPITSSPPVTTSVNPEPSHQTVVSTRFEFPPAVTPVTPEPPQALAATPSGPTQGPALGFGAFASHRPSLLGGASATSAVNSSSPITFAPPAPVPALGTTTTSAFSSSSAASGPSTFGPMQAPTFGSGATATSVSSPFDAPSPLKWGSMQVNGPNTCTPFSFSPPQDSTASAFPPQFGYPGGFSRPDVGVSPTDPSRYFGPTQDFAKTRGVCASSTTPKNPFPTFGVNYLPRCPTLFGPNPQTPTPVTGGGSFLTGFGTEQGSRYPRYAPTPDLEDSAAQGRMMMSISASNSHRHKSHEELRWEDYKNGDKGGFRWFPPAHTSPFSAPTILTPSLFAPPSIPGHPQRITIGPSHRNMTGFPTGYTPTAVQRPAGVSGCTACGATSNSSPSVHLGLNGTTHPPSSATSLPGLFFSCPLLFGTPNLAAYGTTPALQAYAMIFGVNFTSQGTTTPAVQAYPMMFGTPNLAGQGTFGTPNLVAQGTTTTPAAQPFPTMYGTPNIVAQGTTNPPVQPYPMMFCPPNLGAQGITPAVPVHGLNPLP